MHVMTSKSRVCIIPGDGAAPEAMLASLRVLDALALPIECDAVPPGSELLDLSIAEREALIRERVDNADTALFGSSDGTTPGAQYLRWGKLTFANVRPIRWRPGFSLSATRPDRARLRDHPRKSRGYVRRCDGRG